MEMDPSGESFDVRLSFSVKEKKKVVQRSTNVIVPPPWHRIKSRESSVLPQRKLFQLSSQDIGGFGYVL
jgi:hypothetical protein